MSKPTQTSDIIFPALATNFSETLASLKRSTLSISNRLSSIAEDAEFVCRVADTYGLPLVANERCGSWYIPPERKEASAYFKSTDGHYGEWSMSLRRLNMQVIELVNSRNGCIIVDSTRRGKSMPDALSKTIPIWCTVWNCVLFPELMEAHALHTPHQCVSPSEHSQMEQRLNEFVVRLKQLDLDLSELRKRISKPMRPIWITRDSDLFEQAPSFADYHPVVLCTASRRVRGGEMSEHGYIQGAGDDSEGWSQGLTASIFWEHKQELMFANDENLPEFIHSLVDAERKLPSKSEPVMIKPTNWLFAYQLNALHDSNLSNADALVTCGQASQITQIRRVEGSSLHLECRDKKLGSRDLRKEFSKLEEFLRKRQPFNNLLVCCTTGKDLSIGVILAILCLYTDDQGKFRMPATRATMNKVLIRQRLSWIMTSFPTASPSRATLQSVNNFLLTTATTSPKSIQPDDKTLHPSSRVCDLFTSLAGQWALDRTIINFRNNGLAGTVAGSAVFERRKSTSTDASAEYLNNESGTFKTTMGAAMQVNRRWIWRHRNATVEKNHQDENGGPKEETISIHFVKSDGESEDYVYNILTFSSEDETETAGQTLILQAKAEHPCGEDFYVSSYNFHFNESGERKLSKFDVQHEVKGPSKNYISRTLYSRNG